MESGMWCSFIVVFFVRPSIRLSVYNHFRVKAWYRQCLDSKPLMISASLLGYPGVFLFKASKFYGRMNTPWFYWKINSLLGAHPIPYF